jgi:aspartate/methionine/tyrosine aminotransferase
MGMLELREAISEYYQNEYSVDVSPERILVSSGTSPAMILMMMALLNEGDEVILPNPHYACYPNFIEAAGGRPVYVDTLPENGFKYSIADIRKKISEKTKGVLINSPSNPTGIVMTSGELAEIADLNAPYIISDEIYHGLVYGDRARSILEFTDNAFVINGFSKLYAMTGWRLGYLIFPENFSSVMYKIHQNFMISANNFVQIAGIAALKHAGADVGKMKSVYNERRIYMIHTEPTGAFYVFADARKFCSDSYTEAFRILESVKVGVTPGIDFGSGGEGFLRFSYANSIENIKEGLDRIEKYLKDK